MDPGTCCQYNAICYTFASICKMKAYWAELVAVGNTRDALPLENVASKIEN
jgi:hypothetical protein